MDNNLRQTIECRNLKRLAVDVLWVVISKIGRVAITGTNDAGIALQTERQQRTSVGNGAPLVVLNLNGDYSHIPPVGSNHLAVCFQHNLRGWFGGFYGFDKNALPVSCMLYITMPIQHVRLCPGQG